MNTKSLINFLSWKKNPSSIFLIALPLAFIGFGSMFALAIMQLKTNNDPWFLVIFVGGIVLLTFGLWPMRKLIFK